MAIDKTGSTEKIDSYKKVQEVIDSSDGGHAMSVVSYDDNKNGGTFELMNSWGNEWGKSGYC